MHTKEKSNKLVQAFPQVSLYLTLPIEDCKGLLWCLGEVLLLTGDGDTRTGD